MAKLKIRHLGDEILRKKCRPVEAIPPRILTLLDDMTEPMRAADGCGLAAPQVGVLRRLVVIEVEEGKVIELINPKIIATAGEQREREGCLSILNLLGSIYWSKEIIVCYRDEHFFEWRQDTVKKSMVCISNMKSII